MASGAVAVARPSAALSRREPERQDLEMVLLEERLQLLQSQRNLAAMQCQRFSDFLEVSIQQRHTQHQPSPPEGGLFPSTSAYPHRVANSDHALGHVDVWGYAIEDTPSLHAPQGRRRRGSLDSSRQHLSQRADATSPQQEHRPRGRSSSDLCQLRALSSSGSDTKSSSGTPRRHRRRSFAGASRPLGMDSEMGRETAQYYCSNRAPRRGIEHDPAQRPHATEATPLPTSALFGADAAASAGHLPVTLGYRQQRVHPATSARRRGADSGTECADTSEASDADTFLRGAQVRAVAGSRPQQQTVTRTAASAVGARTILPGMKQLFCR